MKDAVLQITNWKSILDAQCIEHCLMRVPGVLHAEANVISGQATVHYDELRVSVSVLKKMLDEGGFECLDKAPPAQLVNPKDSPAATLLIERAAHAGHAAPMSEKPAAHDAHASHGMPAPAAPGKQGEGAEHEISGEMAGMAHEMGHGAGMSMERMVRDMRNRFLVALIFAVPIFAYSPLFTDFFKIILPVPFGLNTKVLSFILATPPILYSGWIFYLGAWRALRNGVLNMAVLVTLSVLAGYLFSVAATFLFDSEVFYEASVLLLVFVLLGHWLEMRARSGASQAIQTLLTLTPSTATVIRDGQEVELPTSEMRLGDVVVVRPGNKVAVDGEAAVQRAPQRDRVGRGHAAGRGRRWAPECRPARGPGRGWASRASPPTTKWACRGGAAGRCRSIPTRSAAAPASAGPASASPSMPPAT